MRHGNRSQLRLLVLLVPTVAVAAVGITLVVRTMRADDEATKVSSRTDEAKPAGGSEQHPLQPYVDLAASSRDAIAAARDYEAVFTKKELVGRTMYADSMVIKFRKEPFSTYLRFSGKNEGREVIYVDGKNQNKLLAHETGFKAIMGTMAIDPKGSLATAEGRHPITEIGMQKMVESLIRQWEGELKFGGEATQCQYFADATLTDPASGEIRCKVLETSHAKPQQQFKFYLSRLYIDKRTNFPIRVEQWGWPRRGGQPYLIEEYTYSNIKPNVGLADADFDSKNRNYRFP